MKYQEYLKKADQNLKRNIELSSKEVDYLLNTPIGELNIRYRNLFQDPGWIESEKKLKDYYNKWSLDEIISNYLKDEKDLYDELGLDYVEDKNNETVEPYFVYQDLTKEPCGFIAFDILEKKKEISDFVLFSFDLKRKDFGKQIWIDLEKCLKEKLNKGYKVLWYSKKSNPAALHYDNLIKLFKGRKTEEDASIWKYEVPSNV